MKPSSEAAQQEMLRSVEAYWRKLRGRHRLPRRHEVQAEMLGAARAHAFLLQRVAPGEAILRSAGAALRTSAQGDPRGLPLSVLFASSARDALSELLVQLFLPAIVEAPLVLPRRLTRPRLTGHLLMLPLVGDDGLASAALGALVLQGGAAPATGSLGLGPDDTIRREPLSGLSLAAEASLSLGALPERIGRPVLRLVVDNG